MNFLRSHHRSEQAGRLAILLAALLWSTSGLFAKSPVFQSWNATERGLALAFWRAAFAALLLLPLARRPRWRIELVPLTLAFAAMNVTFLSAMTLGTAANAIWLQSTAPFWVFLGAVLIWRESVIRQEWIALACAAAGVALILAFELRGQAVLAALLGLGAGVFYAVVVLMLRALRDENSAWLIVLCQLASAAVIAPFALLPGTRPTTVQLAVLAGFGTVQMGLPYLIFAWGLARVGSRQAALLALVEPIVTPVWVYLVWGEPVAWWTLVGGGLILLGLIARFARTNRGRLGASPAAIDGP